MSTLTKLSLPLALALSVPTTSVAQTFDLRDAHAVVRDDAGTTWAIGRDYKAKVTTTGTTFVPALAAAPTDREFALHLERIVRGDTITWHGSAAASGELHADERHVVIDRGAFVERYDCRSEGLEQSFVFARRPAGDGDLVVRLAIATTLQPEVRSDGTPFFHDGRFGGVTLGAVTGIDAQGRTQRGDVCVRDGALELRLPAAFVDAASYPMTLDPLLATGFLIGSATENDDQVDAAYGNGPGTTLVVWRRSYSQFNQDVYGQQIAANGTLSGPLLAITLSGGPDRAPKVGYVRGRDRHVVCWLEGSSMVGPWTLKARSVNGSTLGGTITVSTGASTPNGKWIATSGDSSTIGTDLLVVWARTINTSPAFGDVTILHTSSIEVSLFGSLAASPPADLTSSMSGPTGDLFALPRSRTPFGITALFLRKPDSIGGQNVYALDYDGNYLGEWEHVATSDPAKQAFLAIDGDGTDFVAACRNFAGETITRQITWTGTTFTASVATTVLGTSQSGACAVGFLGERFLVTWVDGTPNPFDNDIHGIAMKPNCELCSQRFTLATVTRTNALAPTIAAEYAAGGTGRALLAWNETDATSPFDDSVVGQRYTAMVGAPPVNLTPGCGNGGTVAASGPFAPGNQNFAFTLSGGDPTAPFAIISLSLGGSFVTCGCEITNWIVLEATLANAGTSSYPFTPWCDPAYLGTTIEAQWLLWPAAQSPCPLVPNLAASNRMQVTLQP